jgi:hypothetical protein
MQPGTMFLDCPAYTDRRGTVRCGLPAEVEDRYRVSSTEGPQESAKIRCPRGHWFNGPIEALTLDKYPSAAAPAAHAPVISRLGGRQESNSWLRAGRAGGSRREGGAIAGAP